MGSDHWHKYRYEFANQVLVKDHRWLYQEQKRSDDWDVCL